MIELTKRKTKTHLQVSSRVETPVKQPRKKISFRSLTLWLMASPAIIWLLIFSYSPMFGLIIAFKNYRYDKGIFGSDWTGFLNFKFLFTSQDAFKITRNTIMLNAIFIITSLIVSLFVAILLNEVYKQWFTRFHQTALLLPYFISWVIASAFVYALLSSTDGLVNNVLISLGYEKIRWYNEAKYWPYILTIMHLWKSIGFWSIIYVAGILGISPEYFESAKLDGANGWQQITHITLPLLMPIIIINVLLSIGRIFYADFGLFYQVTRNSGLLYSVTDVIDTYVYRALKTTGDIGMAAAAGFYQSIVGFILVFLSNWVVRRIDPDKSLF